MKVLLAFLLCAPAYSLQAEFQPLGFLPGGLANKSSARGVNADGTVVVGSSIVPGGTEAFRWTQSGGLVGLGELAGGGLYSVAIAVSADGQVVVGASQSDQGLEAFRWTAEDGMQGLGDLPGGFSSSWASAVSADGSTIVGSGSSVNGPEAFVWTAAGGMQALADLPGGRTLSYAAAVSADGSTVVGYGTDQFLEATRWTAGAPLGLGDFPGGLDRSRALGLSSDGQVVVGYSHGPGGAEAFRWTTAGGLQSLGLGPAGSQQTYGFCVDAAGLVVGGMSHDGVDERASIWTPALGQVTLLDAHLQNLGATGLAGWQLEGTAAVSLDGNTLVGTGINPNGEEEAWLARLAPGGTPNFSSNYCSNPVPNSTGLGASLSAMGFDIASYNYLTLRADQLPANQFGYFLNSQVQGFVALPPGSQGNLCLGGAIGRYVGAVASSGAAGSLALELDLLNTPTPMGTTGVMAGQTWNFQAWYRDVNPAPTSNFSSALSLLFQ